jgi:hypothetical protein
MTEDYKAVETAALREGLAALTKEHDELNELYITEGVKRRVAEAQVGLLKEGIRKAINGCEACGGRGFEVAEDDRGDIDKEPCNRCWELRDLIHDHTDYVLKATGGAEPTVGPAGTCQKGEFCALGDGHQGECDDVPF